jgi:hypothetical protein
LKGDCRVTGGASVGILSGLSRLAFFFLPVK